MTPSASDYPPEDLPLFGLRVLDLTLNIAGPFATMILGDLGAEVTKVERPPHGDDSRRMVPTKGDQSAYFLAINRNKRSVMLDLGDEDGRKQFWDLLATSDVFVTNLRQKSLRDLDLAYERVHAVSPRLIYAHISAYGSGGAEADRAGYDMVLQARSGLMSVNGEVDGAPVRVGVSILDMGAGIWLALGVLAALQERQRTGTGTYVSTSLLETGASFMGYDIAAYELTGTTLGKRGAEHPAFGPYGVFRCGEQTSLAIGAGSDRLFARLSQAVGCPQWPEDPRFSDNTARIANRAELRRLLELRLSEHTAHDWAGLLTDAGVPADEVAPVDRLLDDAQLGALDFWLDTAVGGSATTVQLPRLPFRLGHRRMPLRLAPPVLPVDPGSPRRGG